MMELQQQIPDVRNYTYPARSMIHREQVNIKPGSSWCRRINGTGVVRVATDLDQESARIRPAVLDDNGMRLDSEGWYDRPAMCRGWSGSIILGYGAPANRYIVLRNEGDREVSFNVLFSPE
jgi:hypothetical protein